MGDGFAFSHFSDPDFEPELADVREDEEAVDQDANYPHILVDGQRIAVSVLATKELQLLNRSDVIRTLKQMGRAFEGDTLDLAGIKFYKFVGGLWHYYESAPAHSESRPVQKELPGFSAFSRES